MYHFEDLAVITPRFWDHVTGVYSLSHFTGAPITCKYSQSIFEKKYSRYIGVLALFRG